MGKLVHDMKRLFYSRKSGMVTVTFDVEDGNTFIKQFPFREAVEKGIIGDIGLVNNDNIEKVKALSKKKNK